MVYCEQILAQHLTIWLLAKISPGGGEVDFLADQSSVGTRQSCWKRFLGRMACRGRKNVRSSEHLKSAGGEERTLSRSPPLSPAIPRIRVNRFCSICRVKRIALGVLWFLSTLYIVQVVTTRPLFTSGISRTQRSISPTD